MAASLRSPWSWGCSAIQVQMRSRTRAWQVKLGLASSGSVRSSVTNPTATRCLSSGARSARGGGAGGRASTMARSSGVMAASISALLSGGSWGNWSSSCLICRNCSCSGLSPLHTFCTRPSASGSLARATIHSRRRASGLAPSINWSREVARASLR